MQEARIQSWLGKLGSHMPWSVAKKEKVRAWVLDWKERRRKERSVYNWCGKPQRFSDLLQWMILVLANGMYFFPHGIDDVCVLVLSCVRLCNPIDCSPPGPSIHGILQARTLEWVAISFSKRNYRKKESEVAQSCPTLSDPMDCSLSASSIHGIFQARVLEWVAISFSRHRQCTPNITLLSREGKKMSWRDMEGKKRKADSSFCDWGSTYHITSFHHSLSTKNPALVHSLEDAWF